MQWLNVDEIPDPSVCDSMHGDCLDCMSLGALVTAVVMLSLHLIVTAALDSLHLIQQCIHCLSGAIEFIIV